MDYRNNNLVEFLSNRNIGGDSLSGSSKTRNAASVLSSYGSDGISEVLESSFLNNHESIDFAIPATVLSTIAIALSPNGETVATTHGDHTVKIFEYETAELKQVFVGHPRTPWTVKYHPYNPNIIASGCLGFEVRVWDISDGTHLNTITYDFSIISLSFHSYLPILAVASGPKLYIFNWQQNNIKKHKVDEINRETDKYRSIKRRNCDMDSAASGSRRGHSDCDSFNGASNTSYSDGLNRAYHTVQHSRNIRAVLFHPDGDYLMTAAPDIPRVTSSSYTACRLYFFPLDLLLVEGFNPYKNQGRSDTDVYGHRILDMVSLPYLLPQIHLYSDGGLDISEDGEFLLACAILPGHNRACGMDLSNLDAMDSYAQIHEYKYHTGRLSVDEDAEYGGGVDVETTFSDRMAYAYNKRSFEELILTNPPSPDAAGTTTNMSTDTTGSSENGTFSQFGASLDGVVLSHSANLDGNSASTACNGENEEENSRIDSDANMRPRSAVAHLNTRRFPGLMDPQHTSNSTNGGMVSNPMLTSLPAPPMFQCKGSAFSNRGFLPKGGKSNGQKSIFNETQHYSDKVEDYLCLFKLVNIKTHSHCKDQSPSESGYKRHGLDGFSGSNTVATSPTQHQMSFKISPIIPVLQSAKPLPDNLMRAITSAKLSPSKQYCLLGFGVRTEGVVFGHFASDVACEIIDASTMKPVCVLRDHEDEVNIAQFHPVAGNGILYGTKKGKIRKYQRYEQLQHYTDWDDVSSAEYESREESLSDWGDYKI